MKRVRLLFGLVAIIGLLASCALIPPISVGKDALGYTNEPIAVSFGPSVTAVPLATSSGTTSTTFTFGDVELPALPITPASFQSIQGFAKAVTVNGDLPASIGVGGKLTLTLEDVASDGPDAVVKEILFSGLTLEKTATCTGSPCTYEFSNAAAVAAALTTTISGSDMGRMLEIISEGGDNRLTLKLEVTLDSDPAYVGTLTFTIVVEDNFIRF